MPPKEKYTDPDLRDEVKEEIHQGDKGGAPGQWSARKAQLMASEYKKRGGGYNTEKSEKDESQKHLSKWGEEDWQTKEGSGNAKQEDGSEKRYLPKKAWENMTDEEKKKTDEKKLAESKDGKQFVGNTDKAKKEGRKAREDEGGEEEDEQENDQNETNQGDEDDKNANENDDNQEKQKNTTEKKAGSEAKAGEKRSHDNESTNDSPKKQKSNSGEAKRQSDNDSSSKSKTSTSKEATGSAGSSDRLPKKGQQVQWHSLPGYITGEVLEIVYEEKEVEGKKVKGGKDDPRIVLRSEGSGKIAVHKPEAVFFE